MEILKSKVKEKIKALDNRIREIGPVHSNDSIGLRDLYYLHGNRETLHEILGWIAELENNKK